MRNIIELILLFVLVSIIAHSFECLGVGTYLEIFQMLMLGVIGYIAIEQKNDRGME